MNYSDPDDDFQDEPNQEPEQDYDHDFDNYWNQDGVFEEAVDDLQDHLEAEAEDYEEQRAMEEAEEFYGDDDE